MSRAESEARWCRRNKAKVRAKWKKRRKFLLAHPEVHAAALERTRLWRKASPAAVKRYKAKESRSQRARDYSRAYYRRNAERRRAMEAERHRAKMLGQPVAHPCHSCGAPLTGRPKKCPSCREQEFRAARAILTGAAA